jgi:hypothetical protein
MGSKASTWLILGFVVTTGYLGREKAADAIEDRSELRGQRTINGEYILLLNARARLMPMLRMT